MKTGRVWNLGRWDGVDINTGISMGHNLDPSRPESPRQEPTKLGHVDSIGEMD